MVLFFKSLYPLDTCYLPMNNLVGKIMRRRAKPLTSGYLCLWFSGTGKVCAQFLLCTAQEVGHV